MRSTRILNLFAAVTAACAAQTAAFDVVSVKPTRAEAGGRSFSQKPGGGLSASNATVRMLVAFAFQVMPEEISGGPPWFESDGFDIEAKAANPPASAAQFREMVQTLLSDRFQLRAHRKKRDLTVYVLLKTRGGAKLRGAKDDATEPPGVRIQGPGQIKGVHATMPSLATALTRPLKRRVIDETGLSGTYDFQLRFAPDQVGADAAAMTDAPSIFAALEEQLGLSLKTAKRPVDVVIIDSVQKPASN